MKKLLAFFVIVFLGLVIISCGGKVEGGPGQLETPVTDSFKLEKEYEGKDFFKDGIGLAQKSSGTDGDTARFKVASNSEWFAVRFLGINTPESTINMAPWGKEASAYCKKILENAKEIVLEAEEVGKKPTTDTNGTRYMGYVWYRNSSNEDFRLLNVEMIEQCFSFYTGGADSYDNYFKEAYKNAYDLTIETEDGKSKVGVFGQQAPKFDYSTEVKNITIAELYENFSSYSSGTKLNITAKVIRSVGKSIFVEDVEGYTDPETGEVKKYGIFLYYSYKISVNYEPGTVLNFQCQASESFEYGKQLINPTNIKKVTNADNTVNIPVIADEVTTLKDYEGFVVQVNEFTITGIGYVNEETSAYTIYGTLKNGAELMVRVDGDCSPKLASTSEYLKVGATYKVIGGVSRYTDYDTNETVYQIKLGNFIKNDFEKISK